jgi:hypothetical protein
MAIIKTKGGREIKFSMINNISLPEPDKITIPLMKHRKFESLILDKYEALHLSHQLNDYLRELEKLKK